MDCSEPIRELIPWYVTGRLDPADIRAVDEHLETCADCRAELTEATRVRAVARIELPIGDALDRAWDRIDARLEPSSSRIDVGSFLLGVSFGVSAGRGTESVHGSLRVLGQDVRILGRRRKGA